MPCLGFVRSWWASRPGFLSPSFPLLPSAWRSGPCEALSASHSHPVPLTFSCPQQACWVQEELGLCCPVAAPLLGGTHLVGQVGSEGPPREMMCPEESARAVLLLTLRRAGESAPPPLLIHLCTRHRFRPENQAANRKVTAPCGSQCGLVGLLFPAFGCGCLFWGVLLTSCFGAQGTKGLLPTAEC